MALRKSRNRVPTDIQFRFMIWDFDAALRAKTVDLSATASVMNLQAKLRDSPAYRQLFAERVRMHLVEQGGALTAEVAGARYRDLAAELERAIALEGARWGSGIGAFSPLQAIKEWQTERDRLVQDWFPARTGIVLDQLTARGLAP